MTSMNTQPNESVTVIRIANCYAAAHTQGKKMTFLSNAETNKAIAQATAQLFAQTNNISYVETLSKKQTKHAQD